MSEKRIRAREEELKRSVERLEALMDEIPTGVINVDIKGKITYVNKTILQGTGYLREELVGKNGFRLGLFPRETLKLLGRRMKEKLMGKSPSPLEVQFKRKDGKWMWVEISGKALWEHGVPVGIQIVGQDITERKRIEHNLQERIRELNCFYGIASIGERPDITLDELYQEVANLLPVSWQYPEITCVRININGKKFGTGNCRDTEWKQTSDIKLYGAKVGRVEVSYLEERPELDEGPFLKEERRLLDAVAKQLGRITERKRMEEALQESETGYTQLAESITDVFFAFNEELRYTYWNKASEERTGISAEDALGKHLYDLFPKVEATRMAEEVFLNVLRTKQPQSFVTQYQLRGKEFFFENNAYPSRSGLSVFMKDITERKRMEQELREMQEQLIRSEKLAAIGQLAGGVGHELRNPLGAIKNAVYYIRRKVAKSELAQREPRVMEFLNIMDDEVNSSNKIITDLLGFSRVGKPSVSPTRIEKVIEDALSYTTIPENIELTKRLDADLPEIEIDADQIHQVLVNIITNAVEAMPEGGKLTIGAREKEKFLEVEIADTGGGIPQEAVGKIFDPLFTTKAKGIGLGLAVCKAIIDRHQGNIEVESQVGKGTTFIIKLPLKVE